MKTRLLFLVLALGACDCDVDTTDDVSIPDSVSATDTPGTDTAPVGPVLTAAATLTFDVTGESANIASMALSPDGQTLVATGWGERVIFFDLSTQVGTERHELSGGNLFEAHAAVWNGDRVAVGTFAGLSVFDASGRLVGEVRGRANSVAALGDGFVLAGRGKVTFVGHDAMMGRSIELIGAHRVSRATTGLFVSTDNTSSELVQLNPDTFAEITRVDWADWDVFGDAQWNLGIQLNRAFLYDGLAEVGEFATDGVTFDAFSLAGSWAAATGHNDGVVLFDIATRAAITSAPLDTRSSEAIILDGTNRVFVGTSTGVQIYNIVQ